MARIRQVGLLPYHLPLRAPWPGADAGWRARRGWLLTVRAGEQAGYGDCAPLPADGGPAHAAAEAWLKTHLGRLRDRPLDELLEDPTLLAEAPPAVACAVETALLDLQARLARRTLRTWIDPGARDRLPVNALAGGLDETAGVPDLRVPVADRFSQPAGRTWRRGGPAFARRHRFADRHVTVGNLPHVTQARQVRAMNWRASGSRSSGRSRRGGTRSGTTRSR